MRNIVTQIFIIIGIFLFTNSYSQESDHNLCSEGKIRAYKNIKNFDESKYKEKSSFNYDIKYQRLEFQINPAVKSIIGKVTSHFIATGGDLSSLAFDMNHNGMIVDSVVFHEAKVSNYVLVNNELTINLPSIISSATSDSISVYYHGTPDANGFGSFVMDTHNGTPIIWTLSEPYGARDWWPCKQSLNDKIDSVDIYITNPEAYRAASNGLLISETSAGGIRTAHWKHKHPITAYLIAIAVTNYSVYSDYVTIGSGDQVEVLNYVFPEDLSYAQLNTPNVLDVIDLYSDLFIPYPFKNEKYGHAQFGWGGGMEHQTMSFMVNFSHGLMAHELAHQWFGDYVTCGSWGDIWLNEGFATYLDGMTHEHNLHDDGVSFNNWKNDKIAHITSQPAGSVFVYDTTNISLIFSSRLSYSKGAMVLHMLRKKIGDVHFFQGIKNYLADPNLADGYARTEDFQFHLEQTSGLSLQEFLNDWIYGQGYPMYNIFYSQSTDKEVSVTINQNRSNTSVSFFEMNVPVLFRGITKDSLVIFENSSNAQNYTFKPSFDIVSAQFDPESDLISKSSVVLMVDTFDKRNKVFIVPNPARDKITVTFLEKIMPEKVLISDIYGKLIKLYDGTSDVSFRFEYTISDLSPGLYFISFIDGNETISKKFVKN